MLDLSNRDMPRSSLEAYVLCSERSASTAFAFLQQIAPERRPLCEEFSFPQFSDNPIVIFKDIKLLIEYLANRFETEYSIYWNCGSNAICGQVMLFFTRDGGLIAGIADFNIPHTEALSVLKEAVNGKFGYVTCDSPPPESAAEFVEFWRHAEGARIVDGRVECANSPP